MQFLLPGSPRRMRIFAWLAVASFGGLLLAFALNAPGHSARALANCDSANAAMDSNELQVITLMNAERAKEGLGPLKPSATLGRMAAWKSEDPSSRPPSFSHIDSLGRSPVGPAPNRATDCGYAGVYSPENIAIGFISPESVVTAWMGSPGHRANILHPGYVVAGAGYSNGAWTVNFGTVDDSNVTPGPASPTATATTPSTATPTATSTSTATSTPTATPTQPPTATPTVEPATFRVFGFLLSKD